MNTLILTITTIVAGSLASCSTNTPVTSTEKPKSKPDSERTPCEQWLLHYTASKFLGGSNAQALAHANKQVKCENESFKAKVISEQ